MWLDQLNKRGHDSSLEEHACSLYVSGIWGAHDNGFDSTRGLVRLLRLHSVINGIGPVVSRVSLQLSPALDLSGLDRIPRKRALRCWFIFIHLLTSSSIHRFPCYDPAPVALRIYLTSTLRIFFTSPNHSLNRVLLCVGLNHASHTGHGSSASIQTAVCCMLALTTEQRCLSTQHNKIGFTMNQ